MDGQLTLRSVPGEGACFTLLLPLRLPQAAPAPPPRAGAATADAAH